MKHKAQQGTLPSVIWQGDDIRVVADAHIVTVDTPEGYAVEALHPDACGVERWETYALGEHDAVEMRLVRLCRALHTQWLSQHVATATREEPKP